MLNRRQFLSWLPAPLCLEAQEPSGAPLRIRQVDFYHLSHDDIGFTDFPSVARDMQRRFLDCALDACLADRRFHWTVEGMLILDDWWRASSPARRDQLLGVVHTGQMAVMAVPFNQTATLDARQWDQMFSWVPEELWHELNPRAAIQDDVNGFPRAGAIRLANKGIHHLAMGMNPEFGGPPFPYHSAFWWKMPDGQKIFVWLDEHYGLGYKYFEPKVRKLGGRGGDPATRPPRAGEFLRTDEPSLRASHKQMVSRLRELEAGGYSFDRLILTYTNQWRWDNDPPYPALAEFIEAWNRLGLQPALRFTTATEALFTMEREVGDRIPVHEGEWPDWWANGDASGPRELAASRFAKRYVTAALSPVWGPLPSDARPRVESILKDLCLFDEHTWGANVSVSEPDSLQTIGQYTEKSIRAYRPMGQAEWLLGRRARTKLDPLPEGLYVVNTAREPFTGWVRFTATQLDKDDVSVEEQKSAWKVALHREKDGASDTASFWAVGLPPASITSLRISKSACEDPAETRTATVEHDAKGWPASVLWPGAHKPLFSGEMGDFLSVGIVPPSDRETIRKILDRKTRPEDREAMRRKALERVPATYGAAGTEDTRHTLRYTQPVQHPRLRDATRKIEIWKCEPRARLTLRFDRTSSMAPEVFYVSFALPVQGAMPTLSNGGVPFVPYYDQLKGTCRDYYSIDGWAHYATPSGNWVWVTRDAPIVSVGGPHTLERRATPPPDTHRLSAMVFNNLWFTNFVANSHGAMEFQFDLVWRDRIPSVPRLAEALTAEPVVLVNPSARESPVLLNDLFRP